jgi:hypothetical protein
MKRTNLLYWIITGLFAVMMTFSAVPDILMVPQAIAVVTDHLGYPLYFLPFLGVAKLLGAITLVVPRFPRLKEWAYAGFFFDLLGAMYSHIAVGDPAGDWAPIFIGFGLLFASYFLHHKRQRAVVAA